MSGDEKSHLEVILEDINGKFSLVLEGHVTLEHMIHEHRAETRQDKRELKALIQTSHDSLDAKINKVSNELKDTREELKDTREELKDTREDLRDEMAVGFKTLGDKVNPPGDTLLLHNSPDGIARQSPTHAGQSPTYAGEGALRQKVEGHEDRIAALERKAA